MTVYIISCKCGLKSFLYLKYSNICAGILGGSGKSISDHINCSIKKEWIQIFVIWIFGYYVGRISQNDRIIGRNRSI